MNRLGDKVRINGMRFVIHDVRLTGEPKPIIILKREFDGSLWYAQCHTVTRFTHIKRVFDSPHANMDKTDVMSSADAAMRRI